MYNMSVLDLLDVVVCSFFGKECENERSCICMSYIFIFKLYVYPCICKECENERSCICTSLYVVMKEKGENKTTKP